MRWLRFSWERCLRNYKRTILNLTICLVTVMLLNIFSGNIFNILEQMRKLPEAMDVTAVISNLCGTMSEAIKIREKDMDGVLACKYVVDPKFAMQFKFGFGEFPTEECMKKLNYFATASNAVGGVPGLSVNEITMQEGLTAEDFFKSEDRACIMDQRLMESMGYSIGDEVELTSYYYRYGQYHDIYIDPLEVGNFTIVGSMNIMNYIGGDSVQPDALMPIATLRNIYHEHDVVFYASSGSFRVTDLYHLNELKEEMNKIGFLPANYRSDFQYDGNAITIKDETFIRSAEQLIKNRNLLLIILPFILAAVMCIGFVMAELLMKSRMPEYAIMRSLGQTHRESLKMLIGEYGISALIGSTLGAVLGIVALKTSWYAALPAAIVFFICYMVGTLAAMSALKKLSIMTVLSKND